MPLTPQDIPAEDEAQQDRSRLQDFLDCDYTRPAVALIAAAAAGFLLQKLMRSARRTAKPK